jgi:hypothetical protein
MASLEGWNFTIKLCPRGIKLPRQRGDANSFFGESAKSLPIFSAPCFFEAQCTKVKTQFVRSRDSGMAGHLFLESGRDECGVVPTKTERVT